MEESGVDEWQGVGREDLGFEVGDGWVPETSKRNLQLSANVLFLTPLI